MFQSYNQWILTYDLDSIKKCGYGKMFLGIQYLQKSINFKCCFNGQTSEIKDDACKKNLINIRKH